MLTPSLASLAWLVRDTFRQSSASGVCWLMLGVTGCLTLLCLTARVVPGEADGPPLPPPAPQVVAHLSELTVNGAARSRGAWVVPRPSASAAFQPRANPWARVELAGGLLGLDVGGDAARAVRTFQVHLASWVADTAGLLLILLWTAGFLPTFLDPQSASVLLAKPLSRSWLLLGKCLGVFLFVSAQATLFVGATWVALGLGTGVWDARYFLALPLLLINFTVFFSFSAMLAVWTRSTVASVFGSVAFWVLSWGMNFGRHAARSVAELDRPGLGRLSELGYWLLPKPLDFHILLLESLDAENLFGHLVSLPTLVARGVWLPGWSVAASLLAAAALFAIAVYEFEAADY